ncbi:MAG: SGNH hydrolase domain-containing protein [Bdellovibrio sp.]
MESGKPSVFLWGDSHAAALYPGLRNLQSQRKFGLSQLTHVGNPPFLKDSPASGLYEINNQDIFNLLVKKSPDIVILHAAWYEYKMSVESIVNQINFTISKIKASNPNIKIIVIGPVPTWKDSLQKNILKYYMNSTPRTLPPLYMVYGLRKDVRTLDDSLKKSFSAKGIQYLSAIDILCNSDGCMTRTGPSHLDLTAIDYGHLSEAGSVFLINKIAAKIF